MCGRERKLSKPKKQKQSEENKINSIRKKKKKKKKEIIDRIFKDIIIRDICTLYEREEEKREFREKKKLMMN